EDAFYASEEWRQGPRDAVLADIASYTTVVLAVDEETLHGLRRLPVGAAGGSTMNREESTLRTLNDQYVQAVLTANVAWYEEHLADDFVCIEGDGRVVEKAEFLRDTAKGPGVADYHLDEVAVQFYGGDVALVRATGSVTRLDGTKGQSRYVDVYVRRAGSWRTVSAQITRVTTK